MFDASEMFNNAPAETTSVSVRLKDSKGVAVTWKLEGEVDDADSLAEFYELALAQGKLLLSRPVKNQHAGNELIRRHRKDAVPAEYIVACTKKAMGDAPSGKDGRGRGRGRKADEFNGAPVANGAAS